jgi:hypothetical protein
LTEQKEAQASYRGIFERFRRFAGWGGLSQWVSFCSLSSSNEGEDKENGTSSANVPLFVRNFTGTAAVFLSSREMEVADWLFLWEKRARAS